MPREAAALPVYVECYAGYRGEETPRRFRLGDRQIEIADVVDSWLAPDHRYFKVKDSEGNLSRTIAGHLRHWLLKHRTTSENAMSVPD